MYLFYAITSIVSLFLYHTIVGVHQYVKSAISFLSANPAALLSILVCHADGATSIHYIAR